MDTPTPQPRCRCVSNCNCSSWVVAAARPLAPAVQATTTTRAAQAPSLSNSTDPSRFLAAANVSAQAFAAAATQSHVPGNCNCFNCLISRRDLARVALAGQATTAATSQQPRPRVPFTYYAADGSLINGPAPVGTPAHDFEQLIKSIEAGRSENTTQPRPVPPPRISISQVLSSPPRMGDLFQPRPSADLPITSGLAPTARVKGLPSFTFRPPTSPSNSASASPATTLLSPTVAPANEALSPTLSALFSPIGFEITHQPLRAAKVLTAKDLEGPYPCLCSLYPNFSSIAVALVGFVLLMMDGDGQVQGLEGDAVGEGGSGYGLKGWKVTVMIWLVGVNGVVNLIYALTTVLSWLQVSEERTRARWVCDRGYEAGRWWDVERKKYRSPYGRDMGKRRLRHVDTWFVVEEGGWAPAVYRLGAAEDWVWGKVGVVWESYKRLVGY